MNNSFTQKAQHYLNESYRLTEELNAEIEYSGILEAVLEELVGTEDFLEIMEFYMPRKGTSPTQRVAQDGTVTQRTPEQTKHYLKRLDSIRGIGVRALKTQDKNNVLSVTDHATNQDARAVGRRAAASLIGHGGNNSLDAGVSTVAKDGAEIPSSSAGFHKLVSGMGDQQPNPRAFGRKVGGMLDFDTSGANGARRETLRAAKDRSRLPDTMHGTLEFGAYNRDNWRVHPDQVALGMALRSRRDAARNKNKKSGARALSINQAKQGKTVSLGADGEQITATSTPKPTPTPKPTSKSRKIYNKVKK